LKIKQPKESPDWVGKERHEGAHVRDALNTGETASMFTGSRKRKLDDPAPIKYYAVRAGHNPGVYTSWADCQQNITGFKGAACRFTLGIKITAR